MAVSSQFHAPVVLPRGNGPRYPLYRRLGGPQSRSGRGGEQKNSQILPGLEPPDHQAHSAALYHRAIPTPQGHIYLCLYT
jgi:hypothetical protein